ncbi:TetR/AcrR family transcriptional regulator [Poseidonocella sp. HB161398]|uniref:TetR/AcrR family transcriptional regulator n=1 Tax=Poseidonocella sp. HB161398 TaxID=2320855 RepID=UPI001107ED7C|nr:TetR/AcrR family transcriptional regulator [Poseidonocella sp. HB161398]
MAEEAEGEGAKPGRVLRTDGEATRGRILEAAGALIAEHGFAETPSKVVAAAAGADLASINYHFGNRAGLYRAVLLEAHDRLVSTDRLQALARAPLPAPEKLRRLIEGLAETTADAGGWPARVLGRELLAPSAHLAALPRAEIAAKLEIVLGILSEITALPREDPRLLRCLLSVLGPCAMLVVAGRSQLFPFAAMLSEMPRGALAEHFHRFAMAGLAAVSE